MSYRCIISKSYCKMMQDTKYSTVIFKEQNMVNNIHAFFFIYVNKNFSVKYKYLQKPGHRQHCWPEHWQWHCGRRDSGWSLHWETSTVWYCQGRLRQRCTYKKDYEFCLVNTMLCIKCWAYILKGNWNGLSNAVSEWWHKMFNIISTINAVYKIFFGIYMTGWRREISKQCLGTET